MMKRRILCLVFTATLSYATASDLSVSDLVTSKVFSDLDTIGFDGLDQKQLHPRDYLLLHKEKRLVNFRDLWKKWCISLGDEKVYKTTKAKFEAKGEKFWDLVNGECLFLGPMKWMEPSDIEQCECAPLLNVPSYPETIQNAPKTQNHLNSLLNRTHQFEASDNQGFLSRNESLEAHIEAYAASLTWNDSRWDALSFMYFAFIDVTKMMPPLEELNLPNLPRVLRVLSILKLKKADNKSIYDRLKSSSLAQYADYIQDSSKLTWNLFEDSFNAISQKDHVTKMLWVRSNLNFLMASTEGKPIKEWFISYPINYPDYALVTSDVVSFPSHVQVPEILLNMSDDILLSTITEKFLSMYSVEQQVRFVSWSLRELPIKERPSLKKSSSVVQVVFGKVYQFTKNFKANIYPSLAAFRCLDMCNILTNTKLDAYYWHTMGIDHPFLSRSDFVEASLAYGFTLGLTPDNLDKFSKPEENFRSVFLMKPSIRKPIMEFMMTANNTNDLAKFDASTEINTLVANRRIIQATEVPAIQPKHNLNPKTSQDLTFVDLVESTPFSGILPIGLETEDDGTAMRLDVKHFYELHHENRTLNFRTKWENWCSALTDKEKFENAKVDCSKAGVDFWKLMNGECLFLGPIKWMKPEDIRACNCPPLLGVPVNSKTNVKENFGDKEKLIALLDRTVELKGIDSYGFLNRAHANDHFKKNVVQEHFSSLPWTHPHWDVLSPVGMPREMIISMLPPTDQLNISNLPRILRVIAFLKLNFSSIIRQEYLRIKEINFLNIPEIEPLLASPLKEYLDFLDITPLSSDRFKDSFNKIPKEDHVMRVYWIRANIMSFEKLPANDEIKRWFARYPETYPDFSVFTIPLKTNFKYDQDVKIPPAALALPRDDEYRFAASELPVMYSFEEQLRIASWYLRELPTFYVYDDFSFPVQRFGHIYHPSLPSEEGFARLLKSLLDKFKTSIHIERFYFARLVNTALSYGFHLPLSEDIKTSIFSSDPEEVESSLARANPFLGNPAVTQAILQFLGDAENASRQSVFRASQEIASQVHLCNGDLLQLTKEQLENLKTSHILKYLRTQCDAKYDKLPSEVADRLAQSLLDLGGERLDALLKGRPLEEAVAICHSLVGRSAKFSNALLELEQKITRSTRDDQTAPKKATEGSNATNNLDIDVNDKSDEIQNPVVSKETTSEDDKSSEQETSRTTPEQGDDDGKLDVVNIDSNLQLPTEESNVDNSRNANTPREEPSSSPAPIILLVILFLGALVGAGFFYKRRQAQSQN